MIKAERNGVSAQVHKQRVCGPRSISSITNRFLAPLLKSKSHEVGVGPAQVCTSDEGTERADSRDVGSRTAGNSAAAAPSPVLPARAESHSLSLAGRRSRRHRRHGPRCLSDRATQLGWITLSCGLVASWLPILRAARLGSPSPRRPCRWLTNRLEMSCKRQGGHHDRRCRGRARNDWRRSQLIYGATVTIYGATVTAVLARPQNLPVKVVAAAATGLPRVRRCRAETLFTRAVGPLPSLVFLGRISLTEFLLTKLLLAAVRPFEITAYLLFPMN
jgi:hypothetical protein